MTEQDFAELRALAVRAQAGDSPAYESLLQRLYPFVRAVVRARIGPGAEVDDLTQECLLAVHKSLRTFHPSRNLKPWLLAIVRYKVADHFRAQARRKEFPIGDQVEAVTDPASRTNDVREETDPSPVDVSGLVADLPEPLRRAVTLTRLLGLSSAEAARREGLSDAALRKRVSRAYRALAKAVEREREGERGD